MAGATFAEYLFPGLKISTGNQCGKIRGPCGGRRGSGVFSGRCSSGFFSARIRIYVFSAVHLIKIGDQVHPVFGLLQTGKAHGGAWRIAFGVFKEIIEVLRRPDIGHRFKCARISKAFGGIHGTPNHVIEIGAGRVLALFKLVTGFALAKDLFAFASIRRQKQLAKAWAFIGGFVATFFGAGFNHVPLCVLVAVTATHRVNCLCRPVPHQKDKKGPAERANGLGKCHCVEHGPVSI